MGKEKALRMPNHQSQEPGSCIRPDQDIDPGVSRWGTNYDRLQSFPIMSFPHRFELGIFTLKILYGVEIERRRKDVHDR